MNDPCRNSSAEPPESNEELVAKPGDSLLLYLSHIHDGVNQLFSLLYSVCSRPSEVFNRHHVNDLVITDQPLSTWEALLLTAEDVCAGGLTYLTKAVVHFVTAPWYWPEDYARRLYIERMWVAAVGKQPGPTVNPISKGTVRVKWFPDLEAPLQPWPEGLAELWTDLPVEADGSLDLRPLKRMWGMENIYVIDANHGRRMRIGREPDEVLSALAWTVLLGRHSVLGVVEVTSPPMRAARRARAFVTRACTDPVLWLDSLELAGWTAVTLSAIVAFAFWSISCIALGIVPLVIHRAWRTCVVVVLSFCRAPATHARKAMRWWQSAARRRTLLGSTHAPAQEGRAVDSSQARVGSWRVLERCAASVSYLGSILIPWLLFAAAVLSALIGNLVLDLAEALLTLGGQDGSRTHEDTSRSEEESDGGDSGEYGEYDGAEDADVSEFDHGEHVA